jgi:O-acetyl-ADP-ribose deacetylase (regulator of RNase III)
MYEYEVGQLLVQVIQGSIVEVEADAIVCPSNSFGHMRGGVAQAIRLAGGDEIEEAVRRHAPIPLGEAVSTAGGALNADYVIHAPTMREPVEISSKNQVRGAAAAALRTATALDCRVVAFPGMGTGTGEVSFSTAATTIVGCIRGHSPVGKLRVVKLVAQDERLYGAFSEACGSAKSS